MQIYSIIVFLYMLLYILQYFKVIPKDNEPVGKFMKLVGIIVEPPLNLIRKLIGSKVNVETKEGDEKFDLSPIILWVAIGVLWQVFAQVYIAVLT